MCKDATKTAAELMSAIEPTVVQLLTLEGIADTPDGKAAISAFEAAQEAVASWTPGTSAQDTIQVVEAFTKVFDVLPIPPEAITLENLISAGIVTVIGVLSANSPATQTSTEVDSQSAHQAQVVHDTTVKVQALVPGFKRSIWHSAAGQYKDAWNKEVKTLSHSHSRYEALKQ